MIFQNNSCEIVILRTTLSPGNEVRDITDTLSVMAELMTLVVLNDNGDEASYLSAT